MKDSTPSRGHLCQLSASDVKKSLLLKSADVVVVT
ncbi:hypothetical protein PC116_g25445 [Phytophthora cactorum]|nr:hypothetical protein PC116_g25445 [Phytophthora cactorum]